ncbi:MAG TPA: ATP-binding protein [Gemmatimonadaceae bacterium]|nr:ATP-binding protein [Gemmatimonadaceae bacterium]
MKGPTSDRPDNDQFSESVELQRAPDRARYDGTSPETLKDNHEHLLVAYEELSVAEEQLRAQHAVLVEAQRMLEVQRNRYLTLFDFAPDPYLVTDETGVIEEINSAAGELFDVPARLLVGKSIVSFIERHAQPDFYANMLGLLTAERIDKWMIEAKVRDGRLIPLEATVSTLENRHDGKKSLCWLLRDTTARRETEESMHALNRSLNARVAQRTRELELALSGEQTARREAETANRIKSELFARLSHEFRTPLHAVSGYLEILQQNIHGGLNDEQRKDVERIHQAQEHLLALVNMILDFAKLEGGPVELSMAEIPIEETLRVADSLVAPQFAKKRVTYTHRAGDPRLTVFADREKVQQIIVNLLANAVKFTPTGGAVEMDWRVEDDTLLVRVKDNGSGIPDDKVEQIFEPFVQLRSAGSLPTGGTGLGLPISRDLARAMGGEVTATSTVGVGSVFTLRLPLRKRVSATKLSAPDTAV